MWESSHVRTARHAAGPAGGALSGCYPDPTAGHPAFAGYSLSDDFQKPPAAAGGPYGDLDWDLHPIGAAAVTVAYVTPTADTEIGVAEVDSGATAVGDEGVATGWTVGAARTFFGAPTVGFEYRAKLYVPDGTHTRAFSGLIQNYMAFWGAPANSLIGFRAMGAAAAANWYGVVRSAAIETTIDLGVLADATWRCLMWRREIYDGTSQIGFYVGQTQAAGDHNLRHPQYWARRGGITTNIPAAALTYCPLAVVCRVGAGANRTARIDIMECGGPTRRMP